MARAAPTSTIVESQIKALPVLERNFLALAQTMPGAAPNYISKFSRVKFGSPADQRNGFTTLIDGGSVDDAIWGTPRSTSARTRSRNSRCSATSSTRSTARHWRRW